MDFILTEVREETGWITLNNPQKKNALSAAMLEELILTLREFNNNKIEVVILRAPEGVKVWSAGHDITELPKERRDPLPYENPLERVIRAIQEYPGPVIAMVQGGVWGGACDLVMTCDIVIGDHSASFAITPVKLGVPYNASGILKFINILGLHLAKEMFFTAEPITAERANRHGVMNHLVPAECLEDFTYKMAKKMSDRSSLAIAVIKEQFRILSDAHPISPENFERIQGLRRKVYDSDEYREGIQAFLEKRPPVFKGE